MARVACAWLRNDLRVHDSPALHRAAEFSKLQGTAVLPVYVFDPRHFSRTKYGTLKTGPIRALFLLQSVLALKRRLRRLGSDLLVKVGKPEEVLPELLESGSIVVTQEEVTSEELRTDQKVRAALEQKAEFEYCWGSTMFHKEDLPFQPDLADMPNVYTSFKNKVEPELACKVNTVPPTYQDAPKMQSNIQIRPCFPDPAPGSLPLPTTLEGFDFEPSWGDLPYSEPVKMPTYDPRGVLEFQGGEEAGLARLHYYMHESKLIATYFDTRNEMLGGDYSMKFAPWLAHGCLSVRKVFEQLRRHEVEVAANKSTYWCMFGLGARDFFRYMAKKHGDAIFYEGGVTGKPPPWTGGDKEFQLWADGQTGYPFIDANMRELKATGFMSNRGRQNVASFLILDLGVDWRRGADWFESVLIDYDVTANWVNWMMAAGLTGGRLNRFNVLRQSKAYDPDGDYIRHWVPELADVPKHFIHEPWLLPAADREALKVDAYPAPCVQPGAFPNPSGGPVPVQLRGKGKGGNKGQQGDGYAGGAAVADAQDAARPARRWKKGHE
eukprot:TRINITY_DN29608_c0_g3_i1.p1 TRINITY_DN29608_c0_g3~~TRINITY_DN29608_c0_g3_i1.p1  ORF type:complete len:551 (-),score=118.15 TRINITY_DN29608_c0_g3_i1:103-1755(-)